MTRTTQGTLIEGNGSHAVRFYEHDAELTRAVGRQMCAALRNGATAIVIATQPHHRAIEAHLKHAGVDLERAPVMWLDAAETLASIQRDGQLARSAFRQVIGTVVSDAAATGRTIWAFGEMVSLLWEAGDVIQAIELEELWHELGQEVPFSLLCAYRTVSVADPELAGALTHLCQLHPSEVGGSFPADCHAPGDARRFIGNVLRDWGHDAELVDDAKLVLSELATNAVIHADSSFQVVVRPEGPDTLRLAVRDASSTPPVMRDPTPLATSGRGLHVIDALATRWGFENQPDGKTVWAEFGP